MKTPFAFTPFYTLYLESYNNNSFIHCDCLKWNKSIKESLIDDVEKFVTIHRKPIFAIHEIADLKHLKFLKILGFVHHSDFKGMDNIMRQLFVKTNVLENK